MQGLPVHGRSAPRSRTKLACGIRDRRLHAPPPSAQWESVCPENDAVGVRGGSTCGAIFAAHSGLGPANQRGGVAFEGERVGVCAGVWGDIDKRCAPSRTLVVVLGILRLVHGSRGRSASGRRVQAIGSAARCLGVVMRCTRHVGGGSLCRRYSIGTSGALFYASGHRSHPSQKRPAATSVGANRCRPPHSD